MEELDNYALKALIEDARRTRKGKLMDAGRKAEAELAEAELQKRITPYLEAIAENPCDPQRYIDEQKAALEFWLFALQLMEGWHDVYAYAIREESWFIRHFLNALERRERAAARPSATPTSPEAAPVTSLASKRASRQQPQPAAATGARPPPPEPNNLDDLVPLPIPGGPVYPWLERDDSTDD